MGKYFGTDGFRGEANVNLTVEHAYKVGRFLGWFYGKNHEDGKAKIVIGKDTRRSSYMLSIHLQPDLQHQELTHIFYMLQRLRVCHMLQEQKILTVEL